MPQHADAGSASRHARDLLSAVVAWHDARPRASLSSARGWLWTALVAATFFWMSNPIVFIPSFYLSLGEAMIWTKVVVVLSLPWLRLPRVPWPWLAFLGLALLSQLWTINDFHTDVSNTVYIQITALAVIVAANCTPEVVAWGMGLGGLCVAALSLHAFHEEVAGASYVGVEEITLLGVGTNENILAYTLAISAAGILALGFPAGIVARIAWVVVLGVDVYVLYLAGSGTGYLACLSTLVVALVIAAWPQLLQMGRRLVTILTAGVIVVVSLGALLVVTVLDKELSTISGRAPLWRAALEATLEEAPLLGSGWGAVWEHPWDPTPPNDVAMDIYARAGYPLPHGHNLFVDVVPELGLLGVTLALAMVAYAVREIRKCGLRTTAADPLAGRLVLLALVALLVSGITEPMLTVPLGWWCLALVVALSRQGTTSPRNPPRTGSRSGARRIASPTTSDRRSLRSS